MNHKAQADQFFSSEIDQTFPATSVHLVEKEPNGWKSQEGWATTLSL
jgi:hypothetical protein